MSQLLALFGHGAMSDLSPLCSAKRTSDAVMRVPTAFVPISVVPKSGPTHSDDWELSWDRGAICPNVPTVPGVSRAPMRRSRSPASGGGGDQNIRVEHVHVHEGGQAIVGVVSSRP